MDPNANINEQREIAQRIADNPGTLERREDGNVTYSVSDDAERLAELVLSLDEWRHGGGFDPYANTDPEALPTVPQLLALRKRMRKDVGAHIFIEPFDLPPGYVLVRYTDGFECGISREGDVSS